MTSPFLCMGCMEEKDLAEVCPKCGWTEGPELENSSLLTHRTLLNGQYLLGRVLGQGGFGITYLAWDIAQKQKRAVKEHFPLGLCSRGRNGVTVKPTKQEAFDYGIKKFEEEGKALAQFKGHFCIVSMYDFFHANGTAYLVMEYVDGLTLEQYLNRNGDKMPFELALRTMTPVMDALREVHAAKLLHRDVSPSNIYINNKRQVKLLDFGSTRQALQDRTQNLTVMIKEGYTPIEQYGGLGRQGPWTDVYGVAATLYRTITGRTPQPSPSRLAEDEVQPPSRLGISIGSEAESALLKGLSIRPEARFRSIAEFQRAFASDRPRGSTQPDRLHYLVGWLNQNAGSFAISAIFGVILIFGYISLRETRPMNQQPSLERSRPETSTVQSGAKQSAGTITNTLPDSRAAVKQPPTKLPEYRTPQRQVDAAIKAGDLLSDHGHYNDAIAAYQRGLSADPSNSELHEKIRRARRAKETEQAVSNQ